MNIPPYQYRDSYNIRRYTDLLIFIMDILLPGKTKSISKVPQSAILSIVTRYIMIEIRTYGYHEARKCSILGIFNLGFYLLTFQHHSWAQDVIMDRFQRVIVMCMKEALLSCDILYLLHGIFTVCALTAIAFLYLLMMVHFYVDSPPSRR